MAWTVENKKADELDVLNSRNDRISGRGSTRDKTGTSFDSGKYNVIGLNATKSKEAADSIVSSCDIINKAIDGITMQEGKLNEAVKGEELQEALKEYLTSVKGYMKAVVSDVKAFADKLYEVSEKWNESQKSFAGSVNEAKTSSFGSNVSDAYNASKAQSGGTAFEGVETSFQGNQ